MTRWDVRNGGNDRSELWDTHNAAGYKEGETVDSRPPDACGNEFREIPDQQTCSILLVLTKNLFIYLLLFNTFFHL